jgi:hypothetical protein
MTLTQLTENDPWRGLVAGVFNMGTLVPPHRTCGTDIC